jgi:hypothetical protein
VETLKYGRVHEVRDLTLPVVRNECLDHSTREQWPLRLMSLAEFVLAPPIIPIVFSPYLTIPGKGWICSSMWTVGDRSPQMEIMSHMLWARNEILQQPRVHTRRLPCSKSAILAFLKLEPLSFSPFCFRSCSFVPICIPVLRQFVIVGQLVGHVLLLVPSIAATSTLRDGRMRHCC